MFGFGENAGGALADSALVVEITALHLGHFIFPDVGACLIAKTVAHFWQRTWSIVIVSVENFLA